MLVSRQADLALEVLRVVYLVPKAYRRRLAFKQLGGGSQAHLYNHILPVTRPHLLIVPVPGPHIFKLLQ